MVKNLLLTVFAIILSLFLAEGLVRVTGIWNPPDYGALSFYADPGIRDVPYLLKPGLDSVWGEGRIQANSLGLRDSREPGRKPAGNYRILALGDSITFGFGVGQRDSFPEQMEQILNEGRKTGDSGKFEVINAGMPGFNIVNEAALLETLADRYQPDAVVWTIVQNDYDDSLGVLETGHVTTRNPEYVVTSGFLKRAWGLEKPCIDAMDFRRSMKPEHVAWAAGQAQAPGSGSLLARVATLLESNSRLVAFSRSRVTAHLEQTEANTAREKCNREKKLLMYAPDFIHPDGSADALPKQAPVFLSPRYIRRFDGALTRGIDSAASRGIPVLIVNMNVPLRDNPADPARQIFLADIAEYLGMPIRSFRTRHNLGWDSHYNATGNRKLARAIISAFCDTGLVTSCPAHRERNRYYGQYWQQYEKVRDAYVQRLLPYIDFTAFSGIHQVVGGVYPPRVFPVKHKRRANFLVRRPSGSRMLVFRGLSKAAQPQLFSLSMGDGATGHRERYPIRPGVVEIRATLPDELLNPNSAIVDIQLECISPACGPFRLDYIGFTEEE